MDASAFLIEANRSGIGFTFHGDTLTVRPASRLTSEQRQFIRQHKPELIRQLAARQSQAHEFGLEALAAIIAAASKVSVAAVLGLLDDEDKRAISTGSDPARAEAWCTAVRSIVHRGEWKPLPGNPPAAFVECKDCRHATGTQSPGLIDCAARVPSMAAVGPFQRWATDRHSCRSFTARQP